MNLGSCDNEKCGKLMTIADCIQEEDGHIFCCRVCKENYAGRNLIVSGNPLPLTKDVFYDDWNTVQFGEVPDLRGSFPASLDCTQSVRRMQKSVWIFLFRQMLGGVQTEKHLPLWSTNSTLTVLSSDRANSSRFMWPTKPQKGSKHCCGYWLLTKRHGFRCTTSLRLQVGTERE